MGPLSNTVEREADVPLCGGNSQGLTSGFFGQQCWKVTSQAMAPGSELKLFYRNSVQKQETALDSQFHQICQTSPVSGAVILMAPLLHPPGPWPGASQLGMPVSLGQPASCTSELSPGPANAHPYGSGILAQALPPPAALREGWVSPRTPQRCHELNQDSW